MALDFAVLARVLRDQVALILEPLFDVLRVFQLVLSESDLGLVLLEKNFLDRLRVVKKLCAHPLLLLPRSQIQILEFKLEIS